MDRATADKIRYRAKAKRDRAIKEATEAADAEYEKDMSSLRRMMALLGDDEQVEASNTSRLPMLDKSKIGPASATREAIHAMPGEFTVRDLETYVVVKYPEAGITRMAISSALSKMLDKEATTVRQAEGRHPGLYRSIPRESQSLTDDLPKLAM